MVFRNVKISIFDHDIWAGERVGEWVNETGYLSNMKEQDNQLWL